MNRRLTIGLVVVFAALLIYALVVQLPKDNAANATATTAPVSYLWTFTADKLNGVHAVDRVKGQSMDLVKGAGGAWSLVNPGPQPAEQSLAAAAASSLTTLQTDGNITTSTDLAAFGVLSPTLTVEVDLSDGTKQKVAVGDKSPTGSDYYALRAGETQVVLLSTAAQGTLANLLTNPPVVPPTPTATVPTPGPGTPSVTPPASATAPLTTTVTAGTATSTPTVTVTETATTAATATSTVATPTAAAATNTIATPTVSHTSPASAQPANTPTPGQSSTATPKGSATP